MRSVGLFSTVPYLLLLCTASNVEVAELDKRGGKADGRLCDFTDGYYVSWTDTKNAAAKWCRDHAGKLVKKGQSIDDGQIKGYKSGKWDVSFYAKYQNDHTVDWEIQEDECNHYLLYIAQGCTKGGNRPSDSKKQMSDGGTFYEPLMGSIDFKWTR